MQRGPDLMKAHLPMVENLRRPRLVPKFSMLAFVSTSGV